MKFGVFGVRLLPFFDESGGGAGAPAAPPAGGAPTGGTQAAAAPGSPAASGVPGAPAGQPSAPAAPAGFTYKEDRSNWVPSHVVRKNSDRLAQMERDLHYERQRVAALSGVQAPAAPVDPEQQAIRDQLYKVVPELKEFLEMKDKLKELSGVDFKQIQSATERGWTAQGHQALNLLQGKVKAAYGGGDVSPKTVQRVVNAFIADLQHDNEMRDRYEQGDFSVIDEFISDFTGVVLDPFRRTSQAAAAPAARAAARLPRGGGSSAVAGGPPAPTVKPSDGDKYHEAAFARFNQGR